MARKANRKLGPSLSEATRVRGVVHHPRYGDAVIRSGLELTAEEIRNSFYGYRGIEDFYPESAIPADLTRQNFTAFPRPYYVDMLKRCGLCERPFIFFAKEQRYWYETLAFHVDADCRRCVECRRSDRELKLRFARYSKTIGLQELSDERLATLVEDALLLWTLGILRNEQAIRRLRNMALARIPGSAAARRVDRIVSALCTEPERP